jgi:hypothetical protein
MVSGMARNMRRHLMAYRLPSGHGAGIVGAGDTPSAAFRDCLTQVAQMSEPSGSSPGDGGVVWTMDELNSEERARIEADWLVKWGMEASDPQQPIDGLRQIHPGGLFR